MKRGWWIWTSTVILLALFGPEAEPGSPARDLSGGAMQSYDSRMLSSAMRSAPHEFGSPPRDVSGGALQNHDSQMLSSAVRSAPRDFSGDALQSDNSRMVSSPVMPFLGQFGAPFSTYIVYPPARSMATVKAQVHIPDLVPTPSPTAPTRPKFWTARCGEFVALDASSTMNLMEEERKPCSR